MASFRFPCASLLALLLLPTLAVAEPLEDRPVVWQADDRRPLEEIPAERDPLVHWTFWEAGFARPTEYFLNLPRNVRRLGAPFGVEKDIESVSMNRLGEVPNSTWFTNRIGLAPLTEAELAEGPALGRDLAAGPDRSEPWIIIGAKTAGVTPGFRIKDARGDVWLLKFDPPQHPGMTIRSGVVSNLLFHAIGYNVPVDRLVTFSRANLRVGEGAMMRMQREGEVPMTEANLDSSPHALSLPRPGHQRHRGRRGLGCR